MTFSACSNPLLPATHPFSHFLSRSSDCSNAIATFSCHEVHSTPPVYHTPHTPSNVCARLHTLYSGVQLTLKTASSAARCMRRQVESAKFDFSCSFFPFGACSARVTRVSCIALGLPRTTLTRVALVVVVIVVVTLQMHYKHTHTHTKGESKRERERGKWRHAHAHIDTYWQYLRIFAAWPKSPRGRKMLGMQTVRDA